MIVASALGCVVGNGLYAHTRTLIPSGNVLGAPPSLFSILLAAVAFVGVAIVGLGQA